MWCLLLTIATICFLIGIKKDEDWLSTLSCICIVFFMIASFSCLLDIINSRDIAKQIQMYQEENQAIEQQINVLVENYMTYEGNTFKEFRPEDSIALVSLYPELKSDQLVIKQMEIYEENNTNIKMLKAKLIDVNSTKWWLYFGGR